MAQRTPTAYIVMGEFSLGGGDSQYDFAQFRTAEARDEWLSSPFPTSSDGWALMRGEAFVECYEYGTHWAIADKVYSDKEEASAALQEIFHKLYPNQFLHSLVFEDVAGAFASGEVMREFEVERPRPVGALTKPARV